MDLSAADVETTLPAGDSAVTVPPALPAAPRRPERRADCAGGPRPCPWVSCAHHLLPARLMRIRTTAGERTQTSVVAGADMSVDDAVAWLESMPYSCALDVADAGVGTLEQIAEVFGVTRERVRKLESAALEKVLPSARRKHLAEYLMPGEGRGEGDEYTRGGRTRRTRVVPAEDRAPTPPPADWSAATHPSELGELAASFWCSRIAAPMSGSLCVARHASRKALNATYSTATYPQCADCPDGAALHARLGAAPAPAPDARRHLPLITTTTFARPAAALRLSWFGDDDESPAAPETAAPITTDEAPVTDTETTNDTRDDVADESTTKSAPAKCAVGPCANPVAAVRSDTKKVLRECCRKCRLRGHVAMRDGRATAKNVVSYLTDTFGRTGGAVLAASRAKPAAKSPAPTPRAEAPAAPPAVALAPPSLVAQLADARRALELAKRVGGIDVLEQIVAELEGMR